MSLASQLICSAADQLGVPWSRVGDGQEFIALQFRNHSHFIINNTFGLISNVDERISLDKSYQYQLLHPSVSMPKTLSYLDPFSKYGKLSAFPSHHDVATDIQKHFSTPFIVKKNQGTEGSHVYRVEDPRELLNVVKKIFNLQDAEYDYVLLAQEYIQPAAEYRVIFLDDTIQLAYKKDISSATFTQNLSPLHWQDAKAVPVTMEKQQELQQLVHALRKAWPIQYAGLDVIEDLAGKYWLIEVNSAPAIAYYVKDNGVQKVAELYKAIILKLQQQYETKASL